MADAKSLQSAQIRVQAAVQAANGLVADLKEQKKTLKRRDRKISGDGKAKQRRPRSSSPATGFRSIVAVPPHGQGQGHGHGHGSHEVADVAHVTPGAQHLFNSEKFWYVQ